MAVPFSSIKKVSCGDIVVKNRGTKPLEVTSIEIHWVYARYIHSGVTICDHYSTFKPYKETNDQTIMSKKQLFSWTNEEGSIVYGTYLATNSSGEYVVEEKQTGRVVTKSPKDLEEVIPWTFLAKAGNSEQNFTGNDSIKKGDVLHQTQSLKFWVVKEVNTKCKSATKFVGRRVLTEEIESPTNTHQLTPHLLCSQKTPLNQSPTR